MFRPSTPSDASCSYSKPIRPLPRLPLDVERHELVRSSTDSELLIRLRPLPSPPNSSPTHPSAPHISITPPTPLPVSTFRPERPRLSTLQTAPAALLPRVKEDYESCSPLTPAMPQAPSPTTARNRQMLKIRRHLGAAVPSELFLPQTPNKIDPIPSVNLDMVDSESESEEEEEPLDEDYAPVFTFIGQDKSALTPWTAISSYNPACQRRLTLKKWVWEKDGRRWDEKNYDEILDRLRKL